MTPVPMTLLILGDSIALGVTDIVAGKVKAVAPHSFVDQLRKRLCDWRIEVDAAIHRTSSHAINLLPKLLREHQPQVVLLFLGGSDADINWKRFILSDGQRIRNNTALEQFEQNLNQLAAEVQQTGARVLLTDLPDQDLLERGRQLAAISGRDVVALIEASGGQAESDRQYENYSGAIDRVAEQAGVSVARWAERVRGLPASQRFGPDAIHPSDTAHNIIAEVVGDLVENAVALRPSLSLAAVRS